MQLSDRSVPTRRPLLMYLLVVRALTLLLYVEFIMALRPATILRAIIKKQSVRSEMSILAIPVASLSRAVDVACVLYFKEVRCLQRSVATTLLLKQFGIDSMMVTGAQILPYEFHAWVEVDGIVVNDRPYMRDIYKVLECC